MTQHALVVLASGPDIRQFLHSGLSDVLRTEGSVTWGLAAPAGRNQLPPEDNKVALSELVPDLPRPLEIARRLAERAYNARRQRLGGQGPWVNFVDTLSGRKTSCWRRILDTMLGIGPAYSLLVRIERALFSLIPLPRGARARLHALGANVLLMSVHETTMACALLWMARRCGIRSIIVQNSWKDAYARSHVAVAPDILVVPSTEAAAQLANANLGLQSRIIVQDTLHSALLTDPAQIEQRSAFCARYGFNPEKPFACYTAAAPNAVHGEPLIVADLLSRLQQSAVDLQLLLRLNPMEDDPARWAVVAEYPGVALQLPEWDYNAAEKWSEPRRADTAIWASTIAHSAFNISVPSTVTRDFRLFDKQIVNIVFDAETPGSHAESTTRFWCAPFYGVFRESEAVIAAFSPLELYHAVVKCLSCNRTSEPVLVPNSLPDALSSIIGLVEIK